MVNENIKAIVDYVDDCTSLFFIPEDKKLCLLGDWDSPFLKSIKKKANHLNINCTKDILNSSAVVYDTETADISKSFKHYISQTAFDLDSIVAYDMTCVAKAIDTFVSFYLGIAGKNIVIVGRGHATHGLFKSFQDGNATVTIANSFTKNIFETANGADIVIYATPNINDLHKPHVNELVIDLNGIWSKDPFTECEYVDRIGPLTVSILINRFAKFVTETKF